MDGVYRTVLSLLPELSLDDIKQNAKDFLFWASLSGNSSAVRSCLSQNIYDINRRVYKKQTAIMAAAWRGQQTIYHVLMCEGAELSYVDEDGNNSLHLAAEGGCGAIVSDLLSWNLLDINSQGYQGRTAAHFAALNGQNEVFRVLVSAGANVSVSDNHSNNCLHLAVEIGNGSMVGDLLSRNIVDINARGYLGRTALHIAALKGNEEVFRLFVTAGADLTLLDDQGSNCLHLAVNGGNRFIVKDVLSKNILDVNSRGPMGHTALMMAVVKANLEVVDLLVSHGADIGITTDKNNNCLTMSVVKGHTTMLRMLLEMRGTDVNCRGQNGRTPVMIAALLGKLDEFNVLVSANADLSVQDEFGNDCLMLASTGGCLDIVHHLLSLETFDINRQQENGSTSVLAAARGGHLDVFELLVSHGADVTATCSGNNCLIMACEGGNVQIVQNLISLNKKDINNRGHNGWTPLMITVRNGMVNIFDILVSAGADVSMMDNDSNNCLLLASIYGQTKMADRLLLMEEVFDVNERGQNGLTALLAAANEGHEEVFRTIVTAGANMNVLDDFDNTCLIVASIGRNVSVVNQLLAMGLYNIEARDKNGWTALMASAVTGNIDVFEVLLHAGADVTVCDKENDNCLMLASIGGDPRIVDLLISTNKLDINAKGSRGWTSAMFAAFYGKAEIFSLLLAEGANVSTTDDFSNNCLILAIANGHTEIVRHILESESVNVNCRGRGGCTPIFLAAHGGHKELFELLLSRGADLSVVDENNASFIHYTTREIQELVKDVPVIKNQLISELRGSFVRSHSSRGSFRGSFIGKVVE